jgi:hypothetical protein
LRCKICQLAFRTPPVKMREDQICSNCRSKQSTNSVHYEHKFKNEIEQHEKNLKIMKGKNTEESSWDQIKIGREIWPPNIDKILFQYNMAEAIDPKYFQIFKDRARLYYVLNEIKKSNEEYERWKNLDGKWDIEVNLEMDLRKNFSNKNIYPWEKLKKFFERDTEIIKKEFKREEGRENIRERGIREEEEIRNRREREERRRIERRKERNRKKRERESMRRAEQRREGRKTFEFNSESNEDFESDNNIEFMYYDQEVFGIITTDIKNGIKHTYESIKKISESFKIYFEYLEKKDENRDLNFTKLYEYCKIKIDDDLIDEKISDSKFSDYYVSNKKYLDKWTTMFCEMFMVFYQNYHNIPIKTKKTTDIKEILETKINEKNYEIKNKVKIEINNEIKTVPDENRTLEECIKLIGNYKKRIGFSEHNIELMEDMIEAYHEVGSLQKLCQETGLDISIVRQDFRNLLRVPVELKELTTSSKLIADPILATEIAVYSTDYFEWDQDIDKTKNVLELAKNMAQIFKDTLDLRKEFFATNDDYSKPISANTKKHNELNAILEDWPVKESKYEFNRSTDRTGRQYKFIVYYSKDLDAVRFLRRWEYEKSRRISKKWASEMIDQIKTQGNAKEFVKEYSKEFKD